VGKQKKRSNRGGKSILKIVYHPLGWGLFGGGQAGKIYPRTEGGRKYKRVDKNPQAKKGITEIQDNSTSVYLKGTRRKVEGRVCGWANT